MTIKRRTALAAVPLLLGLGAAGPPAGAGPAAPAAVAAGTRTVTLVTGDRVTVAGSAGHVAVERGPGRAGVTFSISEGGGRLRVVPSDAAAPLRTGRLDPALFDVTGLLEAGYDRRPDIPLIVTHAGGTARSAIRSTLDSSGARVTRDLPAVRGVAARAATTGTTTVWNRLTATPGVAKVWLDGRVRVRLDESVPRIGAPAAWAAGYTGKGVTVAVLDTGVDAAHPDLAGAVVGARDFTGGANGTEDHHGHGTHVAGTIAGSGAAAGGRYRGVAPDASLLVGKVLDEYGYGEFSWIIEGMQWAAEQGADVVNMSLGTEDTPGIDPLEEAVNTLTARYGTLFAVSAGNLGPGTETVGSPGSAEAALTVGAVDGADALADFSSRGPRIGDGGIKPDITAPGVDITAPRSSHSPRGEGAYLTLSGTSMAAPHVAGAAALLAQQRPDWDAARLKAALTGSAIPRSGTSVYEQGAGRLDVARAVGQSLTATSASVSFGRPQWPHEDDKPATRTVGYRNHGGAPVTVDLDLKVTGPDGAPAPQGMFRASATTLTVPAGGEASVEVTVDTSVAGPDGRYSGLLTATAGDVRVTTALGVDKEIEHHDLTLVHTDRAGQPAGDFYTTLVRTDAPDGQYREVYVEAGLGHGSTTTLRLPRGAWQVTTGIPGDAGNTMLIHPGVELDRAQTVALDARLGQPMSVTLPHADATPRQALVSFRGQLRYGRAFFHTFGGDRFEDMFTAQLGPDRAYDGTATKVDGQWAGPGYAYHLAWFETGRMVTGFQRTVTRRELTAIRGDYARQATEGVGRPAYAVQPPGYEMRNYLTPGSYPEPFTLTHYLNTGGGVRWQGLLWTEGGFFEAPLRTYRPGRGYAETFNRGVFGPVLPWEGWITDGVSRAGDAITVAVPVYGDGAGRLNDHLPGSGKATLYRDGVPVAELPSLTGEFTVPPGAAAYRLVLEGERGAPHTLTTRSSVAWTFHSGHTAETVRLPVSVVRFAPALDNTNTAPAGRHFTVPVTVQPQPGSAAGPVRTLRVDVSYDDGATWLPATLNRSGAAVLHHPAAEGYVSLRASATDAAGNTVEQTIIRAYRIAP